MVKGQGRHVPAVYDLAGEAGFEAGDHPAPEQIFEYQQGLLVETEKARFQDHLALCPDCARMVLEIAGAIAPDLPEVEELLSQERAEALWPAVREQLPLPSPSKSTGRRRWFAVVALPLAASLLLATVAASFWAWSLSQENNLLKEPRVNVVVRDLVPLGEQDSFREEERGVGIPQEAGGVLLVLNLADLRPFPVYRVEILDSLEDGKLLWASDTLQRALHGNFTLQVPRPSPGSGRYRIRLFGLEGSGREPLAEYVVDLRKVR